MYEDTSCAVGAAISWPGDRELHAEAMDALPSSWIELSCSSLVRCSVSTRVIISLIKLVTELYWATVRPFSMERGMRKGSTLFAITSFVRPSLEFEKANLYIPTIAIITAGSFEGIWGRAGRTSSMTCHLSMCSSNLPMQIRLFTLRRFGLIPALQSLLTSQKGGWWRCRGFLFLAIMQPSGSAGPRALHSTFGLRLEYIMFYFRHQQMETTAKAYVSRITFIFSWEHVKYNNYFEFSNSSGKTIWTIISFTTCKTGYYGKAELLYLRNSRLEGPVNHRQNIAANILGRGFLQKKVHFLVKVILNTKRHIRGQPAWIWAGFGSAPSSSSLVWDLEEHAPHSLLCWPSKSCDAFGIPTCKQG